MLVVALLLAAGAQDAPRQDADGTQRWSILADPCAAPQTPQDEILVCGQGEPSPRLPLPGERGPPDHPVASNSDLSGAGALAAAAPPCATLSQGCTVGVNLFAGGTFVLRLLGKLADPDSCCEEPGEATDAGRLVKDAWSAIKRPFRKKVDKSKRVPIPLDDPRPEEASGDS